MKAKITEPCNECPWRRKSPPGWLGGFPPAEFLAFVQHDIELACHKTCGGSGEPSLCAGALIHYRNRVKRPNNPVVAAGVDKVQASADVFSWPWEFLDHHESGPDSRVDGLSQFEAADREALAFWLEPDVYRRPA